MDKISCDICMDLIPLVKDGIASEDSCDAVTKHISKCEKCKVEFDEIKKPVLRSSGFFLKSTIYKNIYISELEHK